MAEIANKRTTAVQVRSKGFINLSSEIQMAFEVACPESRAQVCALLEDIRQTQTHCLTAR